jgi:hypothetical protein
MHHVDTRCEFMKINDLFNLIYKQMQNVNDDGSGHNDPYDNQLSISFNLIHL